MAPKEKKRKPATKKTHKPEEQVMSEPRHNMVAYLDPEGKITELKEITKWMRESRINKAITFSTPWYKSLIKEFWNSASVIEVDGKELIQGQVNQVNVDVSPGILNNVLELQDDLNAPFCVPIMCTHGCFLRMKCIGDIFSSQINKGWLPMRYKFLLHVLIQCLSNRRAGYDIACNDLVGFMVALVLNKPFSISKYIYANMKENMKRTGGRTTGNKFWMYPRFLQMIMNIQHPNLPKADNDVLKIDAMAFTKESDNDDDGDDEGDDGGDTGAAGASATGTTGASLAGGDGEDSESDDNHPEPGYEFYLDKRGVRKVRKIRLEDGDDYVPLDTEAKHLKRKQTAARRKKKARKYIGASSVQQSVSQQEPIQEADMNPNLGFTADEAVTFISSPPRSSKPTPMVTSAAETPTVTTQEHACLMASTIRATTSQPSSERRQRRFSEIQQDEKVDFLFTQLQAAACQIDRQSAVINVTRSDVIKQRLEINTLNSTVERQQAEITRQQAEIEQLKAENAHLKAVDDERERQLQQMRVADNARGIDINRLKEKSIEVQRSAETLKAKHNDMKEWYNSHNTKITDGFKKITDGFEFVRKPVNILWGDRCKHQEALKKRDHDSEDPGNPDPSATSEQPPATACTQLIVYKRQKIATTQETSSGAQEELPQLESSHYVQSSSAGKDPVVESADLTQDW
ncbi:hypothetical protein Hdeb2414_s0001g00002531 [Helianthus debilis subsp. tardiflorus]